MRDAQQRLAKDKENLLKMYQDGFTWREIAKYYNCCYTSIQLFFKNNNIKLNRRKEDFGKAEILYGDKIDQMFLEGKSILYIMKELDLGQCVVTKVLKDRGRNIYHKLKLVHDDYIKHEDEVVELYNNGWKTKDIMKKFGVSQGLIHRTLKKYGIKFRSLKKYSLDIYFFDNIDDEDKAYIVGFFLADGTIGENFIQMSLQDIDKYILEKIKDKLKYTGPLLFKPRAKQNHRDQYCLCIHDKDLAKQLRDKGGLHRKSWCLRYPFGKIPHNLFPHFLRGYFDGDGSISYSKRGNSGSVNLWIHSTYDFLFDIDSIIKTFIDVDTQIYHAPNNISGSWRVVNKSNKKKFLDWLYSYLTPSSLFLQRKYDKYREIFYN